MTAGPRMVIGAFAVAAVLAGCGASEDKCRKRPADETAYGQCEAIIGVYFDVYRGACIPVSGCGCDESCRAEELPFTDVATCEEECADTAI